MCASSCGGCGYRRSDAIVVNGDKLVAASGDQLPFRYVCPRTHACTRACLCAHASIRTRALAHMCIHAPARTRRYPCMYTHACRHASHHTHTHAQVGVGCRLGYEGQLIDMLTHMSMHMSVEHYTCLSTWMYAGLTVKAG